MTTEATTSNKPADVFKTFPEFTKLTLADRSAYEQMVGDYPPISDISFPTLMLTWNVLESCAVARLGDNLVLSYWFPGMEEYSGLSLIGEHEVDESICALFDHLKEKGETPRLVHVPEFVFRHIKHPDLFVCKAERNFDEYIYRTSNFIPSKEMDVHRRDRIKRFVANVGEGSLLVKSLDLSDEDNHQLLLQCGEAWQTTGRVDDRVKIELDMFHKALDSHDTLKIRNLCLFVGGELRSFCLYYLSKDNRYATVTTFRIDGTITHGLDYAAFVFVQKMADQGASYLNLEYDLGSKFMRTFKLSLGPHEFFRKYTIEPAD